MDEDSRHRRHALARWFVGGTLNVAHNCVDRHVQAGRGDRIALHFEGEPGDSRDISYTELRREVCRAANALTALGVSAGDRVAIYLPMIPEAVVAMLACARIGAVHSVVFGGFSAEALRSRITDARAVLVITADGGYRRGGALALKPAVDEAVPRTPTVRNVLVVRRTGQDVAWDADRDVWWHDALGAASDEHDPQPFDAEHPLFILYTSGTTGRPKGILHTTGGYLTQTAFTHRAVFDLRPETDVYWCTADIGWVTGHSYVVYGPLANGATQVIYEGTPETPHRGRLWEIVQKHRVTQLYTAPTLIRTLMKWGEEIPSAFDLSSLRLLGSVGEPINPEAWIWYRRVIGGDRTPVVDTWWQTETGAIMISPLPAVTTAKPGSAQVPLPGISAEVVDARGRPVPNGSGGYLVLTRPWPAMLRGIWGDPQRYLDTYWSRFPGVYFAGDGAKKDADGDIWLLGRVDDVMNVSGHRLSTTEIESALVSHPLVAEAAVVGAGDETTGQAVCAFVILRQQALAPTGADGTGADGTGADGTGADGTGADGTGADGTGADGTGTGAADAADIVAALRAHVTRVIGPIARPRQVTVVSELPKTRSGKIMRRLLRDIAENRTVGDTTTLADETVMRLIRQGLRSPTTPRAGDPSDSGAGR